MNVSELQHLSEWYTTHYVRLNSLYNQLISPIQHNSSQQNKQPVEDQLENLLSYLRGMSFNELSLQQLQTLNALGIDRYIGVDGARFVERLIRTAEYDPNTASVKLQEALTKLAESNPHFTSYLTTTNALGFSDFDPTEDADAIIIRVGFQNEAGIEHLTDWKDSARDWYDIIRGVSMAANEAPEDTKIVGAATGSIILFLSATAAVTVLLALISKNLTSVAKDVIGIGNQIEELRAKKWINREVEKQLRDMQKERKTEALGTIMEEIKKRLPDINGEQNTALETSVKKLLAFNEKGGNLDFVAPPKAPSEDGEDEEDDDNNRGAMAEVRGLIHEYQSVREQMKLLENRSDKP